jgi:hypothetical protein
MTDAKTVLELADELDDMESALIAVGGPEGSGELCAYAASALRDGVSAIAASQARVEALRETIDMMMRECGSDQDSVYARNACIIGAAALTAGEVKHD